MQNRGQQHHRERLTGALREELSTILAGELGDPRIGLVTLTDLVMGTGNKSMRAYVSVEGTEKEAKDSIEGLNSAVGFIRHELASNLDLRKAPDLSFHLDRSEKVNARIDELIKRVKKAKK
jgi:ribosome-binding factor A